MSNGFNFKIPAVLAPNEIWLCPLKLWSQALASPLYYESPRWHLLPIEGCLVNTENLLFSIATFINYLSLDKAGLKLNIKKLSSWQVEGKKVEAVTDFLFLGSKITVDVTAAMKLEDDCILAGKLWQI